MSSIASIFCGRERYTSVTTHLVYIYSANSWKLGTQPFKVHHLTKTTISRASMFCGWLIITCITHDSFRNSTLNFRTTSTKTSNYSKVFSVFEKTMYELSYRAKYFFVYFQKSLKKSHLCDEKHPGAFLFVAIHSYLLNRVRSFRFLAPPLDNMA